MRYELFKIIDSAFVQSLLEGNLYMNPLSFFRALEEGAQKDGNKAQIDPMEGICGIISKTCLRQLGFHFNDSILDAAGDYVTLISENYGYNNLFCLYRLKIDEDNKIIQKPSGQLVDFNDKDKAPKVVVWFRDSEEFLRRLEAAIHTALEEQNLEYAIYGGVIYEDNWASADGPGTRSAFHKDASYAYQEEWRLCILRREWEEKAVFFPVGNLKDLCEVIPLEKFLDRLDQMYPGYTLVEHVENHSQETYQMFGKINAVCRLMYAYMPQMPKQPTRSDKAEADWHYTRFLELSGRQQEIDSYLDEQLLCYKDLEHLELLAQYRLSQNHWVKATDAFAYMLENASEQIKKEPGRFFFPLHTILMQHQEVTDAARLMEIAVSRYQLPKELEKVMMSDCLMALGFYDQAERLFKGLQQKSADPILEYDLAVVTFYLLRFEEASKHLHSFMQYFSQSHTVAHHADDLNRRLECFKNHTPLEETSKRHPFIELGWTKQTEDILQKARISAKAMYLGIDALYQLEIAQKWNLVAEIPSIIVVPLTIVRLVDLYMDTGAPVFYRIIEHLESMKNLMIRSPDLRYYVEIDQKFPELPPHYKMERALKVQANA